MDGVVGASGDDDNLVELVGQEVAVVLDVDVVVERQPPDPVHQLDHDGVADLTELVLQGPVALQNRTQVDVLTGGGEKKKMYFL